MTPATAPDGDAPSLAPVPTVPDPKRASPRAVWAMLFVRWAIPLAVQGAFTLAYALAGAADPVRSAADWWLVGITVANVSCLLLLARLMRREGARLRDVYQARRGGLGRDLAWVGLAFVVSGPLGYLPNVLLGTWLFGDPLVPANLSFRPLPVAAGWALLAVFPITQGLAELPTYFGYVMPRLQARTGRRWGPLVLCGLVLAAQHVFLPLLPDARFIVWRLLMFVPFALWMGWIVHRRPTTLPWLAAGHVLLDATLPLFVLQAAGAFGAR